ncbi:MAG: ECF transporter S component [Candidatus Nanopelagicales bacterium]|jgi:energy-coupling factor transport system substrate-specific component|nr:ECF transporter S component [Candidatus Nanopelagicales bacterium]MDP4889040.1 ECF transporter S component [Candidatus Nanopelagicales bacterium]
MTSAISLGWRSQLALGLVTVAGFAAFLWPFVADPGSAAVSHAQDAPWIFAAVIPLLIMVVWAQLNEGGMDAKAVAMLGVLAAVVCVLRPLGAGVAGIEPIWIIIILGGRALGPGFGFVLGSTSLLASAFLTGGVGPWLPFQMLAAGWIGLGAGLLPAVRGRVEIVMLATYGAGAAMVFGLLLNLWFWPFAAGIDVLGADSGIAFVPGAPAAENFTRWLLFSAATSWGFDIPRAIITASLIAVLGRPLLIALRRGARRAAFAPHVVLAQQILDPQVLDPQRAQRPSPVVAP